MGGMGNLLGDLLFIPKFYEWADHMSSTQRAPHPVGTTVRINDFLKYIPVRRQTALRNTAKTLAKIKKMIQAYAMSQPSKRLSFKVLKAKNESSNWVYAPGQNATLMDAVLKVSGAGIASLCETRHWPPRNGAINSEQLAREDLSGYRLVALLPKADSGKPSFLTRISLTDFRRFLTTE